MTRLARTPRAASRATPTLADMLSAAARHPSGVTFVGLREEEVRLSWAEVDAARPPRRRGARGPGRPARRPGGHRAPHRAGLPRRLLRRAARRRRAGAALPAGAARAHGRVRRGARRACSGSRGRGWSSRRAAVARVLGRAVAAAGPGLDLGVVDAAGLGGGRETSVRGGGASDLALVQFSSGSTVDPKPVALSHASLVAQVEALVVARRPDRRRRPGLLAAALPRHGAHRMPARRGRATRGRSCSSRPSTSWPARPSGCAPSARHRGTISAAPHFAYAYAADRVRDADLAGPLARLLAHRPRRRRAGHRRRAAPLRRALRPARPRPGRAHAGLRALRGVARGDLLPARAAAARRAGRPGARSLRARWRRATREVVSVGARSRAWRWRCGTRTATPLPERRLGRIHVRGPSLMQGYLGDAAATARALRDGWLDTGDLGFHAGGELFVHGRAKDLVIVRGANHAPEEFEACLAGIDGLRPGCAVALGFLPDGRRRGGAAGAGRAGPRRRAGRASCARGGGARRGARRAPACGPTRCASSSRGPCRAPPAARCGAARRCAASRPGRSSLHAR